MLPHYSPLKVAEVFSILSALYPGRIDLGLGRAPGTDQTTAFALQRDRRQPSPDDFPSQLAELLGYFEGTLPENHPFARLAALPGQAACTGGLAAGFIPAKRTVGWRHQPPVLFRGFYQPGRGEYRRRLPATGGVAAHDGGSLGDLCGN